MKKFFVIIVTSISLISCTKQAATPKGAANQNIFFQNNDVTVEYMVAKPTATNSVSISFSTSFEKNISRIELMSSTTATTFCTTQAIDVASDSSVKSTYSFNDVNIKGSTMYYLLRFKSNDGDWTYSSYITVKVS
jgi:hypothetical protein